MFFEEIFCVFFKFIDIEKKNKEYICSLFGDF